MSGAAHMGAIQKGCVCGCEAAALRMALSAVVLAMMGGEF